MKYVFIDTNVFLNFYSFNKDHLDKLKKIVNLVKSSKIKLIIPKQVVDEFNRNRENKLKETLNYLKTFDVKLNSPTTCHDFSEMKKIQCKVNELRELSKTFQQSLTQQIKTKELAADKIIYEIFSSSDIVDIPDDVFIMAKRRFDLGNPPGKNNSYGDAINWEICLECVPYEKDLFFIGTDIDYCSDIFPNEFKPFLKDEWKSKKRSRVHYYTLISEFLKENFPDIKISEVEITEEKEAVVQSVKNRWKQIHDAQERLISLTQAPFMKQIHNVQERLISLTQAPFIKQIHDAQERLISLTQAPFIKQIHDAQERLIASMQTPKIIKGVEAVQKSVVVLTGQEESSTKNKNSPE